MDTIAGHYKIIKEIGRGGFGITYLAEDQHMLGNNKAVVKKLHLTQNLSLSKNPSLKQQIIQRFGAEALILEKLGGQIREIPRLLAYLEQDGEFYLVQDFIDGTNLEQSVQIKPWSEDQVLWFLEESLNILHQIQNFQISDNITGVIHRDIKPANFIMTGTGSSSPKLYLIDFGAMKEGIGQLTGQYAKSAIIGTQGFMPPEQLEGHPTFATDVYALGVTSLVMFTGKWPIEYPLIAGSQSIDLQRMSLQISPELFNVLQKSLYRDFSKRYQNAEQMLAAVMSLKQSKIHGVEATEYIKQVESIPTVIDPAAAKAKRQAEQQQAEMEPTGPTHNMHVDPVTSPKSNNRSWLKTFGLLTLLGTGIGSTIYFAGNQQLNLSETLAGRDHNNVVEDESIDTSQFVDNGFDSSRELEPVTDRKGVFKVYLPTNWAKTFAGNWVEDGNQVGYRIFSSPQSEDFDDFETPAFFVGVSNRPIEFVDHGNNCSKTSTKNNIEFGKYTVDTMISFGCGGRGTGQFVQSNGEFEGKVGKSYFTIRTQTAYPKERRVMGYIVDSIELSAE